MYLCGESHDKDHGILASILHRAPMFWEITRNTAAEKSHPDVLSHIMRGVLVEFRAHRPKDTSLDSQTLSQPYYQIQN